jgi:threonine dehydratase
VSERLRVAPVTLDDVLRAREAIGGRLHRTPTFTSATLSERTGADVHFKAELFQRTGSFKPRGVLTNLAALTREEKRPGVIGISAGNHAQALAYGAALEDVDCLVVMWRGASEAKIAATRGYGAEVDLQASGPAEAFERLDELLESTGRTLVHPFDHPRTIAGQGTVGLELAADVEDLDVAVVPIGGGGLISGVAVALKHLRPEVRIVGVEPDTSTAMRSALLAGEPVPVEPRSFADGLNAPFAGTTCLEVCRELVDTVALVSDEEIRDAFRFLYERAKLACEPAGAAATAALIAGKVALERGDRVAVIVSGGNVDPRIASDTLAAR